MEQKKSLILNKLKIKEGLTVEDIREGLCSKPYLDATGIGTIGISNEPDSFEIDILIKTKRKMNFSFAFHSFIRIFAGVNGG